MRKISEILRLRLELNLGYRDISKSLGISVGTITNYLYRARAANITWPLQDGLTEQELYDKLFLPVETPSEIRPLPDWPYIHKELHKKGMTLQLLWREYREQNKDGYCYSSFCHGYQKYTKTVTPVMRQVHKGGEKAFVDYAGMKVDWLDITSGEIKQAEIFVGALGASQFIFTEATATQQLPDWINSHINMFEFFDGVPEVVVPDNLKSGVTKAHRYDPDINLNYQQLAEYYGVAIVPARINAPRDKAKAENAVSIVERQILAPMRNMTFTSIGEINFHIKQRLMALNNKPFQKMPISRKKLFEEVDKPALKPLPSSRYQYAIWKKAKVNLDYHIVLDDHYYSIPYQYIGKHVYIRATNKLVECFYDNKRIAIHERNYKKYKFTTITEHMPNNHREQADMSVARLKNWASKIGINTVKFVNHMMASRPFPQQAFRACLGLLRLSKRYSEARLEKACQKALLSGANRYQQVEAILKNNLEEVPISTIKTNTTLIEHKNIRGSDYYK